MRLVIQRAKNASVSIENIVHGKIEHGLVVLVGIEEEDRQADADWLIGKIINLRIFSDDEGKMNLSIQDIQGQFLIISQFTLHV
jgi:D-tyrosyl-tRNA(Tyr) deacylase